jgi:hypothetical protein
MKIMYIRGVVIVFLLSIAMLAFGQLPPKRNPAPPEATGEIGRYVPIGAHPPGACERPHPASHNPHSAAGTRSGKPNKKPDPAQMRGLNACAKRTNVYRLKISPITGRNLHDDELAQSP